MFYDLLHIQFHYKKNILFYSFLTLELVLCLTLILVGLDEWTCYQNRKYIYNNEKEKYLCSLTNKSNFLDKIDLQPHQSFLNQNHFLYGQTYILIWQDQTQNIHQATLLLANASFYLHYFGKTIERGHVLIPTPVFNTLKMSSVGLDNCFEKKDDRIRFFGSSNFRISQVDSKSPFSSIKQIATSAFEEEDLKMNQTLMVQYPAELPSDPIFSFLKLPQKDYALRTSNQLQNQLNEPLFFNNLYLNFERGGESQFAFVRSLRWISWMAFAVVILGASSIILLFMEERKNELMISYLFGATKMRLNRQLFLELFLVFFLSLALACGVRKFVDRIFSTVYYSVMPDIHNTLLVVIILACLSFIITLFSTDKNFIQE